MERKEKKRKKKACAKISVRKIDIKICNLDEF
jgi:hypothetical protein